MKGTFGNGPEVTDVLLHDLGIGCPGLRERDRTRTSPWYSGAEERQPISKEGPAQETSTDRKTGK